MYVKQPAVTIVALASLAACGGGGPGADAPRRGAADNDLGLMDVRGARAGLLLDLHCPDCTSVGWWGGIRVGEPHGIAPERSAGRQRDRSESYQDAERWPKEASRRPTVAMPGIRFARPPLPGADVAAGLRRCRAVEVLTQHTPALSCLGGTDPAHDGGDGCARSRTPGPAAGIAKGLTGIQP